MSATISLPEFVAKWQASTLKERQASQSHFIELCQVLGQPTPTSDSTGDDYCFEKGVIKASGGDGFADVWWNGRFAWEYKGKHKDLNAAYGQLLQYKDDLQNPPLMVVCDLDRFEVHTNFTNTPRTVHKFKLIDLLSPEPIPSTGSPGLSALDILRATFTEPDRLRPLRTSEQVTEDAAREASGNAGRRPRTAVHCRGVRFGQQ